ncbi:MAG TPA: hypothetical protein VM241_01080 [Candidatus Thermoplasmatota archaeon]|nr:hypothetical protein [Candidatus Thermoplasmatota archaeon]
MGWSWVAAAAVAALAAAGCLQAPALATLPAAAAPRAPETFTDARDGCTGYLLAVLLDPQLTDPFLPPGFHLRDAKDLLRGVSTGQALLIVAANLCAPTRDTPLWRDGAAVLFVETPAVEGERPAADYDLYEIEHYSPEASVRERLRAWEWPVTNVTLADESVPEARQEAFSFAAGRHGVPLATLPTLDGSALFRFGGPTPVPPEAAPLTSAVARIWRDTPAGLGHMDYSMPLPLNLGTGHCTFQPGSVLEQLTGASVCNAPTGKAGWAPQPALVATFSTSFHAVGILQRGVHAR